MMCKQSEDESVWKANTQRLLDLTGNQKSNTRRFTEKSLGQIPMSLYECPKPYHRILSPDIIRWVASTGRVHLHKDTCCSVGGVSLLISRLSERLADSIKIRCTQRARRYSIQVFQRKYGNSLYKCSNGC